MRKHLCLTAVVLAVHVTAPAPMLAQQQGPAGGASPDSFWVEIDHGTRAATLHRLRADGATTSSPIGFEGEFRIPKRTPVAVVVANSNSALYTCSVAQTRAAVPEIEQAKSFLTALGPYFTETAILEALNNTKLMSSPDLNFPAAAPSLERARQAVVEQLRELRAAASDANRTRIATLQMLERMRTDTISVDTLAKVFRDDPLICQGACDHQQFVQRLMSALDELVPALEQLEAAMNMPGVVSDSLTVRVVADARKTLEQSDAIIAGAYSTRRLADVTMNASTRVECDPVVEVTPLSGRALTMTIAPRAMPETQRLATRSSMEVKATALPRFRIVPSVGVSLLYAPDARFTTFSTIKAQGDSAEIIDSGTQDSRLTYGLTLGARWDGFIPREDVRLYLPEITVNPTSDIRAFGVGGALSVGPVKVGAGALWTRHSALSGQSVGQRLRDAAFLRKEDTYSRTAYFSLSIVGWPPFLSGGGGEEKK